MEPGTNILTIPLMRLAIDDQPLRGLSITTGALEADAPGRRIAKPFTRRTSLWRPDPSSHASPPERMEAGRFDARFLP
jgi:hypothetical protein